MESAKSRIISLYLKTPSMWYAGHEIAPMYKSVFGEFIGYSDNCLCTRLNELERNGYTLNGVFYNLSVRKREGKDYCEWGNLTVGSKPAQNSDSTGSGVHTYAPEPETQESGHLALWRGGVAQTSRCV